MAVTRTAKRMDIDETLDTKEVLYSLQCLDYTATGRKSSVSLSTCRESSIENVPQHAHEGHEFV